LRLKFTNAGREWFDPDQASAMLARVHFRESKSVPMRTADPLPYAVSLVVFVAGATGTSALPLTPFRYADQAQRHCPADAVVWLDFSKGKYYSKGQKLYGRGLNGSYVCREEARSSFYRGALIGSR
jgi:hypothetical protein